MRDIPRDEVHFPINLTAYDISGIGEPKNLIIFVKGLLVKLSSSKCIMVIPVDAMGFSITLETIHLGFFNGPIGYHGEKRDHMRRENYRATGQTCESKSLEHG